MEKLKKHNKARVGELPLLHSIANRFDLRDLLDEYIPQQRKEEIPPADALMLLIYNFAKGRCPLYELEQWIQSLDFKCIGYDESTKSKFNDDRFGVVLDRLFSVDRSTLMTTIVLHMVKKFNIDLSQMHNDSTTIKAFGDYSEETKTKTGVSLEKGHSKDHRPDLKQLLFTLTISADGAVPVHHKVYSGNRTDDTTHIETWNMLEQIHGNPNFLYIADCKLCTSEQLNHIVDIKKGKVITVIPETWGEVGRFKRELRERAKSKTEILRTRNERDEVKQYFYEYDGIYMTDKKGYRIHWIYSTEKALRDKESRAGRLSKAEEKLKELLPRLNKRSMRGKESIDKACKEILKHYDVLDFITLTIEETKELHKKQKTAGRPGKNTEYENEEENICTLSFSRNKKILKSEERVDGVFPLLSSDSTLSAKEVLIAYKQQPRLEKRFSQFKSIHKAAPLLCKKVERIEAIMFVLFLALMLQALLEREVRQKMKARELAALAVYPENRDATHPTTAKIFDLFQEVFSYSITQGNDLIEDYTDDLSPIQNSILDLLGILPEVYWDYNFSELTSPLK